MLGEKTKKNRARNELKIVTVRIPGAVVLKREPSLLFTASQVEEVLPEVEVQPLPFAAEWLLGLCAWRQQLLVVINPARLYGIQSVFSEEADRYLVIRTALPTGKKNLQEQEKNIFRCILRVPNHIAAGEIPKQCTPIAADKVGIAAASLTRGIFKHEDGLLIVPDLVSVTCSHAEANTLQATV
ncbi:MAG: hypothetical protein D3923_04250 [Candidatus Electrothrix sp. AR3]|nr:hypothetical protein [Candidatus Electrothrix sp. AR3]